MEQDRKPEISPHIYDQLIYKKGGKNIEWRKVSLISVVLRKLDSYMLKNEIRTFSITIHKNKPKME